MGYSKILLIAFFPAYHIETKMPKNGVIYPTESLELNIESSNTRSSFQKLEFHTDCVFKLKEKQDGAPNVGFTNECCTKVKNLSPKQKVTAMPLRFFLVFELDAWSSVNC